MREQGQLHGGPVLAVDELPVPEEDGLGVDGAALRERRGVGLLAAVEPVVLRAGEIVDVEVEGVAGVGSM